MILHLLGAGFAAVTRCCPVFTFVLPEIRRTDEGEVLIWKKAARMVLGQGQDGGQLEAVCSKVDGEASVQNPNPEDLRGLSFRIQEEGILMESLGAAAGAVE
jgi:hypothetical protein